MYGKNNALFIEVDIGTTLTGLVLDVEQFGPRGPDNINTCRYPV